MEKNVNLRENRGRQSKIIWQKSHITSIVCKVYRRRVEKGDGSN